MSIRDVQASFTDTAASASTSIVGAAGTYLAPNSIDTAPLGTYLTELTANDTQLSANVNAFRDMGGGEPLWLVIDWVVAPNTLTTVDMQLITSASSALSAPVIMYDFGAVAIANLAGPVGVGKNVRQIAKVPRSLSWLEWIGLQAVTVGSTGTLGSYVAWLARDIDAQLMGGQSGFGIK